jgi:uncharacterized membrane protein
MTKTTQKEIKRLASIYTDITNANENDRQVIMEREGWLEQLMYSAGTYGCNGVVYRGATTGEIYVIAGRTPAMYIFH